MAFAESGAGVVSIKNQTNLEIEMMWVGVRSCFSIKKLETWRKVWQSRSPRGKASGMGEVLVVMSLLEAVRRCGGSSRALELRASRLVALWVAVGECGAYRAAWRAYLRLITIEHDG